MYAYTCSNPICGKLVTALVLDVDPKTLERVKPSLKEADSMFRPDADLGYVLIELFILGDITIRFFVWCDHPCLDLMVLLIRIVDYL